MTTEPPQAVPQSRRVLFVCVENSCRSQMAEAFARRLGGGRVEAFSAGSAPSGWVHPEVLAAMREAGYDLTQHRSKGLGEVPELEYDVVVAMGCGDAYRGVRTRRRMTWDLPPPKHLPPDQVREVRDRIEAKVRELLAGLVE
jgi:protein-tyrosine-phosphatase